MAKTLVFNRYENTRVPFLRGILIRSLQDAGLDFDDAYSLASKVRDDISDATEITSDELRVVPTETPTEGIGSVEAPRGTLTHHYVTDERGILQKVNLIVGTTNNHGPISMSIKKAAQGLIRRGTEVTEGVLNKIEMAFRAYDPCFACATHSLPGQMPMVVRVREPDGTVLSEVTRG